MSFCYHGVCLKAADIALLDGPNWLNDQIIAFYFQYLHRVVYQNKTKLLFVSPEIVQCIKIANLNTEANVFLGPLKPEKRDFIFFPLNDNSKDAAGGTHWSLLVFSRPENTFYNFDSLGNFNAPTAMTMYRILKVVLKSPNACFENHQSARQQNAFDCGIFVICNVSEISRHVLRTGHVEGTPIASTVEIENKREDIKLIINTLR